MPTQIDAAAVDQFLSRELTAASIPGAAVAITRGDQVLHVRGYGHDSHHVPVTDRTLFRIASLSKSFTSLAVLQLVDAGRVSLDDSVAEHLPEFRPADPRGADITVRQLLDQTSGLADREVHELNRRQPTTLAEATISLNSARLVAAPGRRFNYHNPNYHVAARLVEVVRGETFENYLRTHVFGPAGMPASTTTNTDDQPVAGLADGHVIAYGQPVAIPAPNTFGAGSGDVVSTAADMADWLIVHANGGRAADGVRLVSEHSLRELHTASAPSGYALGWDTDGPADAPTRPVHSGNLLTYSAYQAVLPNSSYGPALLFNSGSALLLEQTAIFHGLLNIVEGTDSTPGGPRFYISTFDVLLGCLTLHLDDSSGAPATAQPNPAVGGLPAARGAGPVRDRRRLRNRTRVDRRDRIPRARPAHRRRRAPATPKLHPAPAAPRSSWSRAMGKSPRRWGGSHRPSRRTPESACTTARVTDGATPPSVPRTQWKQLATHTLLDRAHIPGPYVLAGHSFGGLYVLTFAATYSDQVAGLVLLESTAPNPGGAPPAKAGSYDLIGRISTLLSATAHLGAARLIPDSYDSLPARSCDEARATVSTARSTESYLNELRAGAAATRQAAAFSDFAGKPLIVVTAGRGNDAPWQAAQKKLATLSTNSRHRVVPDATHASLYLDQTHSAAASQAIRDVVEAVRSDKALPPN